MNFYKSSLKHWAITLLLVIGLSGHALGIPSLLFPYSAASGTVSTSLNGHMSPLLFDGSSNAGEITVSKKALLNGVPVDEVCGGQTVTFQYTVRNNVTGPPFNAPATVYHVNLVDSDATLGDIDGTSGITILPGNTVTYTKTKTLLAGEISASTLTVTGNYSQSQSPDDAVSATDPWPVAGISCEVGVEKRVNGAPPTGLQSFTFDVRTGASVNNVGTVISTAVADANNGGNFGIASLHLNTAYQFCETNLLPGWTTSLSQVSGSFVPNSAGGNPDNSVVCINFTVNPDAPTVFQVNNSTPAGGPARTIGYWKNWSSCSKGGQGPVLDYVLSRFGHAYALPPDPLPSPLPAITTGVNFGSLNINTCSEAVNILDKSTTGGVKKASHPAYNMAAQLLAAKLNIQAGANPRCIAPYVLEAEQLLVATNFTGLGSPGYSASQGARMNTLATYLDRYNNGDANLCPMP